MQPLTWSGVLALRGGAHFLSPSARIGVIGGDVTASALQRAGTAAGFDVVVLPRPTAENPPPRLGDTWTAQGGPRGPRPDCDVVTVADHCELRLDVALLSRIRDRLRPGTAALNVSRDRWYAHEVLTLAGFGVPATVPVFTSADPRLRRPPHLAGDLALALSWPHP